MKPPLPHTAMSLVACLGLGLFSSAQAAITFDDFNVNEGHFDRHPTFSGSTSGTASSSTADRVTTDDPLEGTGHQQLVFDAASEGLGMRVRHLSGTGSAANNTPFTTSSGEDGWIGFYLKTDASSDANWTVQLWIEGAGLAHNGGIEKPIIADGEWHVYEWNLDDVSGGPDGWGSVAGIVGGSATVEDGTHTIDSIIFRNPNGPASTTFFLDFVAKSDSGSISNLLGDPCVNTPGVLVEGPVAADSETLRIIAVSSNATAVTVYQNSGADGALVPVGSKTADIVEGPNDVAVSGLVKGAMVKATQTIDGQESCLPTDAVMVGGGANPRIRVALSIRETAGTGPVGAPGINDTSNLHFLGASFRNGSAPGDGLVVNPGEEWQTLTFDAEMQPVIGDSANVVGTANASGSYAPNDTVEIQVYAFTNDFVSGNTFYSAVGAASATVTSGSAFGVDWSWDPVPGAEGYRLLRNLNSAGFNEFTDVWFLNSLADSGTFEWAEGNVVSPSGVQNGASVQWFGTATGETNNIGTPWGILDALAITIDDLTDTGPFDLYIDNLQNGDTVFEDFEGFTAGTPEVGFRAPGFSGSSVGLLSAPDESVVSNGAADTGTKSVHVRFQWSGTNATQWLRLTTFGAQGIPYPMVNLADPISLRLLLLPVGSDPVPPPAPALRWIWVNGELVLDWEGAHTLLEAPDAAGTYAPVEGPVTVGPYTNAPAAEARYFRLVD